MPQMSVEISTGKLELGNTENKDSKFIAHN
jgi:hypothetical protein